MRGRTRCGRIFCGGGVVQGFCRQALFQVFSLVLFRDRIGVAVRQPITIDSNPSDRAVAEKFF